MSTTPARLSQWFVPTLKEAPADTVAASHRLLARAGFVRPLGAGIYSYLPLARRVLARIEAIARSEMDALGGQEVLLPALQPAEVWQASGRWSQIDETMFRLQDRRGGEYALALTHEEAMTALARDELRSYRQLPQLWYQLQTKFRDEPRPRGGILRGREFLMKDAYSFDIDREGLDRAYRAQSHAYERIFRRLGLDALKVEAYSGSMGGRESAEFVVRTEAGEDVVAHCAACGYAANLETATSRLAPVTDEPARAAEPVRFATPGVVTIEALASAPHSVSPTRQLKTLVYVAGGQPLIAVLRGDHSLNEARLEALTGATSLRPAESHEIVALLGAHPGSLGAVGVTSAPVFVDASLEHRANMVTGANEDGFHLRGVDVGRDLLAHGARLVELRTVAQGEPCPRCETGLLELFKALEVGHIFKLGTRYSAAMGATVLAADGSQMPLVMGSYGIGVSRCLAAIVETHHDADGIRWPVAVAPFHATVLTLGPEPELARAAESLIADLAEHGVEVLYDDREERAGVKFKDADLIGLPIRIGIGRRGLSDGGRVEWKLRDQPVPELLTPAEAVERAVNLIAAG